MDLEKNRQKFDAYADKYTDLHQASIASSGESPAYFADYKRECLIRRGLAPDTPILDFGCGTGNVTKSLVEHFSDVQGYDPSESSIEFARRSIPQATFHSTLSEVSDEHFGAAILSGVLHHVAPDGRVNLLTQVRRKLKPGATLFIFEHNPINPLTRRAVSQCPYDDDAVLLWPWEVKRRLRDAGLNQVAQEFIVFFPRSLSPLRPLEPRLRWLCLGAQTLTYGRVPT